jgi:hypothetical protein
LAVQRNQGQVLPVALSGVRELYLRTPITRVIRRGSCVAGQGVGLHADVDSAVQEIFGRMRDILPPYVEYKHKIKLRRHLPSLLDRTLPPWSVAAMLRDRSNPESMWPQSMRPVNGRHPCRLMCP